MSPTLYAPGQLGVEQRRRERVAAAHQARRDLYGLRNWYDAGIAFHDEREQHRAAEAVMLERLAERQRPPTVAQPEPFERGDHLKVWRNGVYHHDGTYMGNGWVVQYGGGVHDKPNATDHWARLSEFANGGDVEVVEHPRQDREATFRRALQLVECPPPMPYNLLGNNCEHRARWCATEQFDSRQVTAGLVFSGGGLALILMLTEGALGQVASVFAAGLGLLFVAILVASAWGMHIFRKHVDAHGLG